MSKKWMLITGGVVLAIAVVVAVVLLTSNPKPSSNQTVGGSSQTASTSTASASGTQTGGTTPSQGATSATTGQGGSISATGAATAGTILKLKPFPQMPASKQPAHKPSGPVPVGQPLGPLTAAPNPTLSALKLGIVPDGSKYTIRMRPLGFGPPMLLGSRLVIRVDSATPAAGAPKLMQLVRANALVLVDTTHGGSLTKGGTYTASLTLRSDGTKLLPILSNVKAAQ